MFFTEGELQGTVLGPVSVRMNRQNTSLTDVKQAMAREAQAKGANAVARFKYGQKAQRPWEQVFTLRWDSVRWFGEGVLVKASALPVAPD